MQRKATLSYQIRVRLCSKCSGNTEFFCVSCRCDLCSLCKKNHVSDLETIDHNVVMFREKSDVLKKDMCVRHSKRICRNYCAICQEPICDFWFGHKFHRFPYIFVRQKQHKTLDIQTVYRTKRNQYSKTLHIVRSETLFVRQILLAGVKSDIKLCTEKFANITLDVLQKANLMEKRLNRMSWDSARLELKMMINRQLSRIQNFEKKCDHLAGRPVQTLLFIKRSIFPKIHDSPRVVPFHEVLKKDLLNEKYVIRLLSEIKIQVRDKQRCTENERILKLTSQFKLQHSFTLNTINGCHHISTVTYGLAWVSNEYSLVLVNIAGEQLYWINLKYNEGKGVHTVNNDNELIYIDNGFNISKLSKDMNTTTTLFKNTDSLWRPWCVCWAKTTDDLLVGMHTMLSCSDIVNRYNQTGQLTQKIPHDNTGLIYLSGPRYVTENNNGDVVVSDPDAIVVTRRGGRHRFTYRGLLGSGLEPHGICTDPLSHILVCDGKTNTIHMLDQAGQLLLHLYTSFEDETLSLNGDAAAGKTK